MCQITKGDLETTVPNLAVLAYRRPTHYAASPEIKALYASDCQQCGMCCVYYGAGPFRCPIGPPPLQQPPKKFVQIGKRNLYWASSKIGTPRTETTHYLRVKPDRVWKGHNRCAALEGTQGVNVSCSIYSERPHACSDYEPGSPDCLKVRRWARLEPLDDGYGRS